MRKIVHMRFSHQENLKQNVMTHIYNSLSHKRSYSNTDVYGIILMSSQFPPLTSITWWIYSETATNIFIGLVISVIATRMIPEQNQHCYKLPRVEVAWIFNLAHLPSSF
jgi:hypothetical protein